MNITMRTRYLSVITADAPLPDPEDPGGTALWSESFEGGLDGEVASTATTTADSASGSGTLTHSDTWSLDGSPSLSIAGTASHYLRKESASHDEHYASFYYHHNVIPGETAYIYQLYAADGTTVALRVGITAAGLVYLQDSTTGTGAADDLSPALTVGQYYRFDLTAGHGAAQLSIFNEAAINETGTTLDWDTLTITLTATAFSDEIIGLVNTLAAGGGGVSGNLVDEGFEGGSNTTAPTTSTTTADQVTGSGTLTHSTTYAAEGTIGLKVNGTTSHMCRWVKASRSNTYLSFYLRFVTAPGTNSAYLIQVQNGGNTGAAFQLGIETSGKLRIRDSNNGTGGALATAAAALSTNTNYRVDITAAGAGDLTMRYYTGANIDSTNTANAVETLTCTLTATNFADIQVGNVSTIGTAPTFYIDRFKADNTALPSPIGGAAAGPIGGYMERFKSDSGSMPAPLTIGENPPPSTFSPLLVPPPGKVLFGASTPVQGANGTTAAGLAEWVAAAGARPQILHFYKPTWNGVFTSGERAMLEPAGGERAIPFVNIKPGQGQTKAQIAAGGADAQLDSFIAGVKTYPHKVFVALWHEFDNDSHGTGNTFADYAAAWQYVVTYCRNHGLPRASLGGNVVWVFNQTGYSGNSGTAWADLIAMYPGDDYVDWIASDPYAHTGDTSFSDIVQEPSTGSTISYFNWARTLHPSKPFMLAEWGVDQNDLSDSQAAAFLNTVVDDLVTLYPNVKALVYWNSTAASGTYYIQNRALTKAAMATLVADTVFDLDISEAP